MFYFVLLGPVSVFFAVILFSFVSIRLLIGQEGSMFCTSQEVVSEMNYLLNLILTYLATMLNFNCWTQLAMETH